MSTRLSIKEVKDVSIDILRHFHTFCVDNGLKYSLWGGSLIGAIRHKGFIPWDDDIDLCMPRQDYDRFFEIYKDSDDFAAFNYERNGALLPWGRICEMWRTKGWSLFPWTSASTGVYISIFPIDGVESDLCSLQQRFDRICSVSARNYSLKSRICLPCSQAGIKRNFIVISKKIKYFFTLKKAKTELERNTKWHILECRKHAFESSHFVCDLSFGNKKYRPKYLWPKEDFEDFILTDFEGIKVFVIKGYDRNLRLRYGDYMVMPPKEQQKPVHGHSVYIWQ